jgi:hypothetical protein
MSATLTWLALLGVLGVLCAVVVNVLRTSGCTGILADAPEFVTCDNTRFIGGDGKLPTAQEVLEHTAGPVLTEWRWEGGPVDEVLVPASLTDARPPRPSTSEPPR